MITEYSWKQNKMSINFKPWKGIFKRERYTDSIKTEYKKKYINILFHTTLW